MNKKTRLALSGLFSIVIILAAYFAYTFTVHEDDEPVTTKDDVKFVSVTKEKFDEKKKSFTIDGKTIEIEVRDGILSVNNKEYDYFALEYIYFTGPLVFLTKQGTSGEVYQVFNMDGEHVIISYDEVAETVHYSNLRVEDGTLVADAKDSLCGNTSSCDNIESVYFVYLNDKLKIKRLSEKEENKDSNTNQNVRTKFTAFKIILQEVPDTYEISITVNTKKVDVKTSNGILYINNKNMGYQNVDNLYLANDLLIVGGIGQLGEVYRFFDENGDEVIINRNNLPTTVQFFNLRISDGSLYADSKDLDCLSEGLSCDKVRKVEFIYENKTITLRGIYTTNKEKFTKFEKTNYDGAGNAYIVDGKQVELKISDGVLYINNNKFGYFTPQYVNLLDTLLMIGFTSQGKEEYHFFDENGKEVTIDRNGIYKDVTFSDFTLINNSLYAKSSEGYQVEFVYENGIITIYREY